MNLHDIPHTPLDHVDSCDCLCCKDLGPMGKRLLMWLAAVNESADQHRGEYRITEPMLERDPTIEERASLHQEHELYRKLIGYITKKSDPSTPKPHGYTGMLIVFEGIDGAGKSTQAKKLHQRIMDTHEEIPCLDFEPTDGPYSKFLREESKHHRLARNTELQLFIADRRTHVPIIQRMLRMGRTVILDRYYYSTAAYQGQHAEHQQQLIDVNERFAPQPDRVFVLRVDPELAMQRLRATRDHLTSFEKLEAMKERAAFYERLQGSWITHLDASGDPEALAETIYKIVQQDQVRALG